MYVSVYSHIDKIENNSYINNCIILRKFGNNKFKIKNNELNHYCCKDNTLHIKNY